MKKFIFILLYFIVWITPTQASLVESINEFGSAPENQKIVQTVSKEPKVDEWGVMELIYWYLEILLWIIFAIILLFLTVKLIRLLFELYCSKDLRYIRITLPRNDSKLDKERETKKDFKEKSE